MDYLQIFWDSTEPAIEMLPSPLIFPSNCFSWDDLFFFCFSSKTQANSPSLVVKEMTAEFGRLVKMRFYVCFSCPQKPKHLIPFNLAFKDIKLFIFFTRSFLTGGAPAIPVFYTFNLLLTVEILVCRLWTLAVTVWIWKLLSLDCKVLSTRQDPKLLFWHPIMWWMRTLSSNPVRYRILSVV